MILLQQQMQQLSMSKDAMYITAISALVAVIVWLALWLRKTINANIKSNEEKTKLLVEVIKENTQANTEMKAMIQMNTVATTNAAEQHSRSADRLSGAIENLNRDVLRRGGDK